MERLRNIIPRSNVRPQFYHHYIGWGNVHVKFATFVIILIRIFITVYIAIHFLMGSFYYSYWVDILYDCVELLAICFLIIGYILEDSSLTWPYLGMEFASLIVTLINYAISVTALIIPRWFIGKWKKKGEFLVETSDIRRSAFFVSIETAIFSLVIGYEIVILLACIRYFDDEKLRKKTFRERPIILNQESPSQQAVVDMESNIRETTSSGFPNPNFSLVDSDEDDNDHDWHSKSKKANILA